MNLTNPSSRPSLPGSGIRQPLVWLAVLASTLLILVLFRAVIWISLPLMLALIIYYICAPAVEWLRRIGLTHHQAVGVLSAGVLVSGILTILISYPWLGSQTYYLKANYVTYTDRATKAALQVTQALESRVPWLASSHLSDEVSYQLQSLNSAWLTKNVGNTLGFVATWFPGLLIVPYLTFYFLRDGPAFKKMLMRGVPNAFFEKVMLLFHRMDYQVHQYFRGMILLTVLDTLTLGLGLWIIGRPYLIFDPSQALFLAMACAIFAWLPYVGSIAGLVLILIVAVSEAPNQPLLLLSVVGLFLIVRLIDDFLYSPMTVGKSLNIHPLLTVVMIFIGGSIAGLPGLLLVLPVLGICSVVGEIFEQVWFDESLRARHTQSVSLRKKAAVDALR